MNNDANGPWTASARKTRGGYVPVVKRHNQNGVAGKVTTQNPTRRLVFKTREEAVAKAQRFVDRYTENLARVRDMERAKAEETESLS